MTYIDLDRQKRLTQEFEDIAKALAMLVLHGEHESQRRQLAYKLFNIDKQRREAP